MNIDKEEIVRKVDIRHFQMSDLDALARALSKNASHIADYLVDGKMYQAFTIHEYKILIREYVSNKEPYEYFGAFYKGELVGTGVMCPGTAQFGIQLIYWIDEDFQQIGLASKLVNVITDHCFEAGYWSVEVLTDKSNLGSQRVLEKNGFVMLEEIKCEPIAIKDTGRMYIWFRFNPNKRNPFGPRRKFPMLWNRKMILPR